MMHINDKATVPVFGYRSTSQVPVGYVTMDSDVVAELENYALADLYLEYSESGKVLISRHFFEWRDHRPHKNKIALENYLLGVPNFQPNQHKKKAMLVFRDGNKNNFQKSNISDKYHLSKENII